jgi:hypothetical protein
VARDLLNDGAPDVWVKLRGDFVLEPNGKRAIDAEFVRGSLPTGDRPAGSAFGIQGGLFESWAGFRGVDQPINRPIDVNAAAEDELRAVPGIGAVIARRIMEARGVRPFESLDDLFERVSSARAMRTLMEGAITVEPVEG